MSSILQDFIVNIKTGKYSYIYLSEIAPLNKAKVNGQFRQKNTNKYDRTGLLNKVNIATSDRFFTFANFKGQSVKGQGN